MTSNLPAHASPSIRAIYPPRAQRAISDYDLKFPTSSDGLPPEHQHHSAAPPIISPAFTPPSTPGTGAATPHRSIPVDTSLDLNVPPSNGSLVETLPEVECVVRARIPTTTGQEMFLHLYHNNADNKEHLAIVFGNTIRSRSLDDVKEGETEMDRMIRGAYVGRLHPGRTSSRVEQLRAEAGVSSTPSSSSSLSPVPEDAQADNSVQESKAPLVRIHSECYTGETVWSARCDCGEQLDEAARLMSLSSPSNTSGGVIIYLRQEGRGIGLGEKLKAYNLQDLGSDTYEANLLLRHPADARSYGLATAMLVDLGLGGERGIRLLTNNPDKVRAVEGPNREVVVKERVAMVPLAWTSGGKKGVKSEEVEKYLSTKIEKFKHMLSQ
ncbi:hypothetical protein K402DRAFT_364686 [Aulographum hederae CBS 113979]|uniref:GTP cyclohydrolase II n=1 Tax=Aulographum hederae CBS 113979 TaxID=1176131 RepID=A0A6G1GL84_9PEZI|nr:hypothetical protein K402DRAFT_364686 [Aulographum hederae CBS 113979]